MVGSIGIGFKFMIQSASSEQKSALVRKYEHKGTINLFNPPKSNPNGRLASSRLFNKSQIATSEPPVTKENWLNSWRVSAIAIILLTNLIATFVLLKDKFPTTSVTSESITSLDIAAGNTNLVTQEFITPTLNSLSQIAVTTSENEQPEATNPASIPQPLAIPPTNLPTQKIINSHQVATTYYYVLTEYTGEKSLQLAQQQVKNVSLVNFPQGTFIYLGAFSEATSAQQFVTKLKEIGLQSYIYDDKSELTP